MWRAVTATSTHAVLGPSLLAMVLLTAVHQASAGVEAGEQAYDRGDYARALREWRAFAEQGDDTAQYFLGALYDSGQGVPENDAEASKWYQRAAEQGYARAQFALGNLYRDGAGVSEDAVSAALWYRLAAEQGYANSQLALGALYASGHGVALNIMSALKWYRRAAEQGLIDAQLSLASLHFDGSRIPQDYVEAHKWYAMAGAQGDASAQFVLGLMYDAGNGVPPDAVEAYAWMSLAVEQGHQPAEKWRGRMHLPPQSRKRAQARARSLAPVKSAKVVSRSAPASTAGNAQQIPRAVVRDTQLALAGKGYNPGVADGVLRSRDRTAIRAFQRDMSLAVTGQPSEALLARLRGARKPVARVIWSQ